MGKNSLIGENSAPIFRMMTMNRTPSVTHRILLVPYRLLASIGTYATGNPERKKAIVMVVG